MSMMDIDYHNQDSLPEERGTLGFITPNMFAGCCSPDDGDTTRSDGKDENFLVLGSFEVKRRRRKMLQPKRAPMYGSGVEGVWCDDTDESKSYRPVKKHVEKLDTPVINVRRVSAAQKPVPAPAKSKPMKRSSSTAAKCNKKSCSPVCGPCSNCGTKTSPQWRHGNANRPIVCNACGIRYQRTGSFGKASAACGYETFSALGTALLWLTLIGVVALVAVCTTWLLGAWGASALLGKASSISTSAEAAAQKAVDSAQQLVSDLKSTQLNILDGAPDDIKGSSWFKEYYKGVQDINATSLLPSNLQASSSNTSVCDPGCISLDVLAGLAGMENGCLCLTNTLQSLQQGLTLTRQNMLPALIALAVCYLAASLLLIYFTSTRKTASHIRNNIKAYRSDRLATTQPRFGPSGSLDGPLYRVPADAAVDIHGVNHDGSNGQHKYRPNGINGHVNHLRDTEIGGFHATGVTDQDDGVGLRDTSSASAPPMSHLFGPRRPVIAADGGGSSGGVGTSSSLIQPPLQHR